MLAKPMQKFCCRFEWLQSPDLLQHALGVTCQKAALPNSRAATAHAVPAEPEPHTLPCNITAFIERLADMLVLLTQQQQQQQ